MTCLATVDLKEACTNNKIKPFVLCRQKFKDVTRYNRMTAHITMQAAQMHYESLCYSTIPLFTVYEKYLVHQIINMYNTLWATTVCLL